MTLHKPKDPKSGLCPIRDVLDRLSDRWSLLVIHELEAGTLRFTELRNRIGDVSQRMLAQTLRRLEQDGLVSREVFPTVPQRVEYTLTPLGHALLIPLRGVLDWAMANHDAVRAAREAHVAPMAIAAN